MEKQSRSIFDLPIKKYKREILYAVENNDVTVIIAETGTGKTTQIPQFLIQAGYTLDKQVAVSLPRRIACTTLCRRVSEQLACYNGEIAYSIRFDSTVNENTRVKFLTDGMLLQELYADPLLEQYSVVMLDDIHQRSLNTDMLIGFLKKIMYKRAGTLKLIISSATLEGEHIKQFFALTPDYKDTGKELRVEIINITGRVYPVQIFYLRQPTKNYILKAFQTVTYIERQRPKGDVIVFLTSQEQIDAMTHLLSNYCSIERRQLNVLPMHSTLPRELQDKVFETSIDRKIILSTNISESSITIDGLYYVVDTGFVKVKVFDTEKAVQAMMVMPCGKSSARQRTGRAGRVKKGECYRIYTLEGYEGMMERLPPEVLRIDLANYILKLKGLGIQDITSFEILDQPSEFSLVKAIEQLFAYRLIDQNFLLTDVGSKVSQLSLDIKLAVMLMNSFDPKFGCSEEILILVCMLSVERDIFVTNCAPLAMLKTKKKIGAKQGDFVTMVNIFLRYRNAKPNEKKKYCQDHKLSQSALQHATKIHTQIAQQLRKFNGYKSAEQEMEDKFGGGTKRLRFNMKSSSDDIEPIQRCILTGYFMNVAQLQADGSYKNIRSKQTLWLHPTSVLSVVYPEWIVYFEIVKNNKYYLYHASKIELEWLFELAGHYYKDSREELARGRYNEEMDKLEKLPDKPAASATKMVRVGLQKLERRDKKEPEKEGFKTEVLGLKDKSELLKGKKPPQLSFDYQDI